MDAPSSYYLETVLFNLKYQLKVFISSDTISSSVSNTILKGNRLPNIHSATTRYGLVAGPLVSLRMQFKFSNGIVIPPGEKTGLEFISDTDAVRRLSEMEKLQADLASRR